MWNTNYSGMVKFRYVYALVLDGVYYSRHDTPKLLFEISYKYFGMGTSSDFPQTLNDQFDDQICCFFY